MKTQEAAEAIGISPRTLRRWTAEGRIPFAIRLGPRCLVYDRDGLELWLDQRRADSMHKHARWLEREAKPCQGAEA
jgi:excisionase family DNA binding protein